MSSSLHNLNTRLLNKHSFSMSRFLIPSPRSSFSYIDVCALKSALPIFFLLGTPLGLSINVLKFL
jgi:hypothetical protein